MVPFVQSICFLHLRHMKHFHKPEHLNFRSTINPEQSSLIQSFGNSLGINLESIIYYKPGASSLIDVNFFIKVN